MPHGQAPEAFFLPDGDAFVATALTRGPWSPDHQHGGPPAALMARAVERDGSAGEPMAVARMTVEFLRPVPLGPLAVATAVVRAGRTTELVHVTLSAGGATVCRASVLRIRTTRLDLEPRPHPFAPLPPPEVGTPFAFPFFRDPVGYHTAVEVRMVRGTFGAGPTAAWIRMRHPLVPGETPSPLQRVLVAADSGHGISTVLAFDRYTLINPDLSVHLSRMPGGEWIGMDAATATEPTGIGLATTCLHDRAGAVGHALQSLVLGVRPGQLGGGLRPPSDASPRAG